MSHTIDDAAIHELRTQVAAEKARADEYGKRLLEMESGISECISVLGEVRSGNFEARVGSDTLESKDERVATFGSTLNDSIAKVAEQFETIRRQQEAIQELSTPVLEVWDGVIILPIIGVVDSRRAAEVMERLLNEILARQSRFVILDVTGVQIVDTKTADHFVKMVKASRLLGATCIVTGIRPAVAQTLVDIGVDLSSVMTLGSLRDGLAACMKLLGASGSGEGERDTARR